MKLFRVFRSLAYRFAVAEHNFSRVLFLELLTTYAFFYTKNYVMTN